MTFYDQRTVSDCMRCCIASVIGYEYDQVPDFANDYPLSEWYDRLAKWAHDKGWSVARFAALDGEIVFSFFDAPAALWIASGPTERGTNHAVVYRGAKMLHDPHESRAGLEAITAATVFVPHSSEAFL